MRVHPFKSNGVMLSGPTNPVDFKLIILIYAQGLHIPHDCEHSARSNIIDAQGLHILYDW